MSEPDSSSTPDGTPPEPIPVAQVWRPATAPPPPPPPPPSHPNYAPQGQYDIYGNSYGQWTAARPYRPGSVTALGILSIIVASLTFVGVVIGVAQASVQLAMVQASRAMAMVTAAQRAQAQQQQQAAVAAGLPAKEQGLPPVERDVAISVFAARQSLSNERMAQLDAVLAEGGQTILSVRPGFMTSGVVRAAIQSTAVGRSARSNQAGPAIFNLSKGALELYDDHAVFRPEDHAQETIRAQGDASAYLAAHADPTATANFPAPSNTAAATVPPPPPANLTRAAGTAMGMTMLEAGLSFLLAIYLLVTGIITVRGVRAGGLMHWIYVAIKTFLVVLAFIAWAQFDQALTKLRTATAVPGFTAPSGTSTFAMGMSTLAAGYLMLVIVLLLIPATREFYRKQA